MHFSLIVMVEDNFSLSSICVGVCGNHCNLKIQKLEECSFTLGMKHSYETLTTEFILIYSFQYFCTLEQCFLLYLWSFVQSMPVPEGFTLLVDDAFFFPQKKHNTVWNTLWKSSIYKEKEEQILFGAGHWYSSVCPLPQADLLVIYVKSYSGQFLFSVLALNVIR